MQTGTKISGIAHVALITVAFFGGVFRAEPLPFEVHEVSVISSEDFAALSAPRETPVVETPPAPEPAVETPEPAALPEPAAVPEPESAPEPTPEPEPVSEPEPVAPEPVEPEAVVVPEPPAPRPAERVAPEPVAKPPEDVKPDVETRPEVSTDQGADTPQPQQEAAAPEEATDQIVTEADEVASLAPIRSPRPPASRPERPKPAATPVAQPRPETSDAVAAALAEALSGATETAAAPTGPPLSAGEKDALRVAVSQCWNVGSLSSAALATTVVVAVSMGQDGKPITESIRMLSSSGGSDASARDAFGAARRAIIRCGSKGFDLPSEKYGHWRDIEMTFNPERMRIK